MDPLEDPADDRPIGTVAEQAAGLFVQRLYGEWNEGRQAAFESRLAADPEFAQAYKGVEQSWRLLDVYAEAPEMMAYRAEAIATVRRGAASRVVPPTRFGWMTRYRRVAASITAIAGAAALFQLSPYGYRSGEYRTAIGEQRIVQLADHTRISMDAATRLQVQMTADSRTVRLLDGQAQFFVAKDLARPFKVIAGNRTIVAIGTVFAVEYVDQRVDVAMVEGRVAVLTQEEARQVPGGDAAAAAQRLHGTELPKAANSVRHGEIYLSAGQELRVDRDGTEQFNSDADIQAATAWREGKVIFRDAPLRDAIERMNRYSRLRLQIEPGALAEERVSGVFEAGDALGFAKALQSYLPMTADYSDPGTVRFRPK